MAWFVGFQNLPSLCFGQKSSLSIGRLKAIYSIQSQQRSSLSTHDDNDVQICDTSLTGVNGEGGRQASGYVVSLDVIHAHLACIENGKNLGLEGTERETAKRRVKTEPKTR